MKTLAVVIGNDGYHDNAKLNYAIKDASGIASVFSRLGYDVIHHSDVNNDQSAGILQTLDTHIKEYDATIFYFAGHGFQFRGENYLTTIECQIPPPDEYNCRRNSIQLSELMNIYKHNPDKINIVIIDACRVSFERGGITNTFAPVHAPQGTLIAFSTSPGNGAKDRGFGEHGIYTGALLEYIGREYLSVEELFKKVRRTVFNLTGGNQTPWEHTSLIGDFYFNTGQLVHSVEIPYSEYAVKDATFQNKGDNFGNLITDIKSYDWYKQNPAIIQILAIKASDLDKNQQFLLGRNILQAACGSANEAFAFVEDLRNKVSVYNSGGENHVLNGILFEIYFNKHGEFRKDNFKIACFDQVMALRKDGSFSQSFAFIAGALAPFQEVIPFWLPSSSDTMIDIDVQASITKEKDWMGVEHNYETINKITLGTLDITEHMRRYNHMGSNALELQKNVAHYMAAPKELIHINSNIPLQKTVIQQKAVAVDPTKGWV